MSKGSHTLRTMNNSSNSSVFACRDQIHEIKIATWRLEIDKQTNERK